MNDTPSEITLKISEMFQKKSPLERLEIGGAMHETSRYLVTRAILEENPLISEAGLRQELFLKFYSNDFDPVQREKILRHIEARPGKSSL